MRCFIMISISVETGYNHNKWVMVDGITVARDLLPNEMVDMVEDLTNGVGSYEVIIDGERVNW